MVWNELLTLAERSFDVLLKIPQMFLRQTRRMATISVESQGFDPSLASPSWMSVRKLASLPSNTS